MEITVKSKYLKVSPRKMRPVLSSLRGEKIARLLETLPFVHRESAGMVHDLVKAGAAAAKENDIETSELYVKSICCNEGPRLHRRRFRARGRVSKITKRMSHLVLTVSNDITKVQTPIIKDQNDNLNKAKSQDPQSQMD